MAKINENCIFCGTCSAVWPKVFGRDAENNKPTVIKQPENSEEIADFETAKNNCPVTAIEE